MSGYFLIFVGLLLIFFSVISMFKVFADKQPPVQLISVKPMSVNTQYGPVAMDMTMMNDVLNLAMHGMFMFFIAAAGGRIAGVGLGFLRNEDIAQALRKNAANGLKQL